MSLKQKAMQCKASIPANGYVRLEKKEQGSVPDNKKVHWLEDGNKGDESLSPTSVLDHPEPSPSPVSKNRANRGETMSNPVSKRQTGEGYVRDAIKAIETPKKASGGKGLSGADSVDSEEGRELDAVLAAAVAASIDQVSNESAKGTDKNKIEAGIKPSRVTNKNVGDLQTKEERPQVSTAASKDHTTPQNLKQEYPGMLKQVPAKYDENATLQEKRTLAKELVDENATVQEKRTIAKELVSKSNATPKRLALQQIKKQRTLSKAAAWKEAQYCKIENRFKRQEYKIEAWEDHERAKSRIKFNKAEMKLEQKKAKAIEKMQNEIAAAHKKAENLKASATASKGKKMARVSEEADSICKTGRVPRGCFCF